MADITKLTCLDYDGVTILFLARDVCCFELWLSDHELKQFIVAHLRSQAEFRDHEHDIEHIIMDKHARILNQIVKLYCILDRRTLSQVYNKKLFKI